MRAALKFLAVGFGSGLSPFMPGTVGSIAAAVIAWFLPLTWWQIFLLSLVGVYICGHAEKLIGQTDPPSIVFDEFCGMFIAAWHLSSLPLFIAAFLLFRLFDILKPNPINWVQSLPGGWGVMSDDLAAGLLARLLIALYLFIF